MKESPIRTEAEILSQRDDHTFFVKLPNGKEIIGHLPKKKEAIKSSITSGCTVILEMTPFDFEKGRISSVLSN